MKKVVILSAFLTPFRSGAEACAEEVAGALKDQYDMTIVTARLRRDLPHLDRLPSGVRVWRVGFGFGFDKWLFPFLAPRAVKALKPDIVHAILETFAGLTLAFCSKKYKRILTCQTTNRSFLKRFIVRRPDYVTAISKALVSQINSLGRSDVTRIPNGIRLMELEAACNKNVKVPGRILFVGRLEKMKGIDTLLRAFKETRSKRQETHAHLRIVGGGSQRSALEALTKELGISDHVTFVGYVSPDHVAEEFAAAEIFCGLSRSEALGNVFLEAQGAGCAVIGTTVGGIPDIVHDGETGLLVVPDNVEAASSAMEKLLTDDALMAKLVEEGEKNAQAYDWLEIAQKYAEVYELTK